MSDKMDILGILKQPGQTLYRDDLDCLLTELDTGGYEPAYIQNCRQIIAGLQENLGKPCSPQPQEEPQEESQDEPRQAGSLVLALQELAPQTNNPVFHKQSQLDIIENALTLLRKDSKYKSKFKEFAKEHKQLDAAFLDQHHALFTDWERSAMLSVRQMGEEFLEKYFDALDPEAISRHQQFSEGFFMKHFAQLDHAVVLQHGKNEWRLKENRSRQLDVFLRLKGVRL